MSEKSKLEKLIEKRTEIEKQIQKAKVSAAKKEKEENQKRLIELGIMTEKLLNWPGIVPSEYEELLNKILHIEHVKSLIKEKNN